MRVIYKATNIINQKIYIGQTKSFEQRRKGHLKDAKSGSGCRFHVAIRKYGEENFLFEVIEECLDDLANEKEQFWISYFDSYENGYNSTLGGEKVCFSIAPDVRKKISESLMGEKNPNYGKPVNDEIRKKMSESHKMNPQIFDEKRKNRMKEIATGRYHSEQTKKKMSESRIGHSVSEQTRQKLSESLKGIVHSEETRKKMSESKKGVPRSEEAKRKTSETLKGCPRSAETKKKISESKKGKRGKKTSEETKKKLSEVLTGREISEEWKNKI